MTGSALVQPNPSVQSFKIVIKNDQKMRINERFTGIMIAKGHVSPFAKKENKPGKILVTSQIVRQELKFRSKNEILVENLISFENQNF